MDEIKHLRVPPHSIESEQAVLGAMLVDPLAVERVAGLTEADFYRRDHQIIYRAILELSGQGKPHDAVTLADWFNDQGVMEAVGGSRYVIELTGNGIASNVQAYARIVREKALLRRVIDGCTTVIGKAFDGREGADALIDAAVGGLMNLQRSERSAEGTMRDALAAAWDEIQAALDAGGAIRGVPSGLSKLDQHLGGFHRSDLTVIGARPAMGKTALLFGMAAHAAVNDTPIGIITAEQPSVQLGLRMLALKSGVSAQLMRSAGVDHDDMARLTAAKGQLWNAKAWIYDRGAPRIGDVMRVARRWRREHGIKALYVDYLQRIEGQGEKQHEKVADVARKLKQIARDLDIPVIALAQVKRDVETRGNKRPGMADLCDSSEVEKEADQIITLYRDEVYHDDTPDRGTAELLIVKQRHGETAMCRVAWIPARMQFADLDPSWRRAPREVKPASAGKGSPQADMLGGSEVRDAA